MKQFIFPAIMLLLPTGSAFCVEVTMPIALAVFHFYMVSVALNKIMTSTAAAPPLTLPTDACSDKLVTFSTCLPYVAASPNNLTDSPPPLCCDDVSSAFEDGSAICFCYFVLQPKILGFPLNSTKLLSLTSECPMKDEHYPKANFSLGRLCSESAALPPLQSISGTSKPEPGYGDATTASPPLTESADEPTGSSSTEEPTDHFPSQTSSSNFPNTVSSATERIYRFSGILVCILLTFSIW